MLDSCCPPTSLESGIVDGGSHSGGSGARHDTPPSTLLRARLSLSPYYGYGSEIVYPIAEQSDELGHNHSGPDTEGSTFSLPSHPDADDDEDEEDNAGSRSPLLVRHESFESKSNAVSPNGGGGSGGGSGGSYGIGNGERRERRGSKDPGLSSSNSARTSRKKCIVPNKSGNSFSTVSLDQSVFRQHFLASGCEERLDGETVVDRTSASSKDGLLATEVSVAVGTPDLVNDECVPEGPSSRKCSDSDGGLGECDNTDGLSDGGRHRRQHSLKTSLAEEGEFLGQVECGASRDNPFINLVHLFNTLRMGYLNCLNARSRGLYHVNQILYCVSLKICNKFTKYFCELKFSGNTPQRP